jgi:hypothetical protein
MPRCRSRFGCWARRASNGTEHRSRGLAATRRGLAELFFSEADDPLGSLRWNLAELRRALGQPDALRGDPPGTEVDLHLVSRVGIPDAEVVERLAGELLEGVRFATTIRSRCGFAGVPSPAIWNDGGGGPRCDIRELRARTHDRAGLRHASINRRLSQVDAPSDAPPGVADDPEGARDIFG